MSATNTIEQDLRSMPILNSDVLIAVAHIEAVEARAAELGEALVAEQQLEDGRAEAKEAATLRIMQTENPLTGKQHSASSAVAVVEKDPEYAAYRRRQSELVVKVETARGRYAAAKLRAQLAVALMGELAGDV